MKVLLLIPFLSLAVLSIAACGGSDETLPSIQPTPPQPDEDDESETTTSLKININECPHVPKLAKFKQSVCPKGMIWNVLCSDKI